MVHWVCEVNARPKMMMIKGGLDRIITITINTNNIIILIMHRVVHKVWEVNVRPKTMMIKGTLDGIITIITITILITDRMVHKAWEVNAKPCPPCNRGAAT